MIDYSLSPEEIAEVPTVPGSLDASLDALHADRAFPDEGRCVLERPDRRAKRNPGGGGDPDGNAGGAGVLPRGIDAWIAYKREYEADHVWLRSVPAEFQLYDDC
jgi:glutamine synthetase